MAARLLVGIPLFACWGSKTKQLINAMIFQTWSLGKDGNVVPDAKDSLDIAIERIAYALIDGIDLREAKRAGAIVTKWLLIGWETPIDRPVLCWNLNWQYPRMLRVSECDWKDPEGPTHWLPLPPLPNEVPV